MVIIRMKNNFKGLKAKEGKVQGHGFLRKSKKSGLVGCLAIGITVLLGTSAVSADEVTTSTDTTSAITTTANPATNLVEAQGQASSASTDLASQSGVQSGVITQDVTSDELNTAVSEAQKSGVTVSQEATVSHDSLANAQADLANQTKAVEDATNKANSNAQAIAQAEAQNAQIDAENKAEADRVAAENEAGQKAVDEENAKAKEKYESEKSKVEAGNAEIRKMNAQRKSEYDAKMAEIQSHIDNQDEGYISEAVAQDLVFKKEANVENVIVDGAYQYISPEEVRKLGYSLESYDPQKYLELNAFSSSLKKAEGLAIENTDDVAYKSWKQPSYWILAKKDQSFSVTYDGLDNTTFNDKKITKVVYTITPKQTEGNSEYVVFQMMADPTQGLKYGSASAEMIAKVLGGEDTGDYNFAKVNDFKATYFYEDGTPVDFSEGTAIVSAGSRNGSNGKGEYLRLVDSNAKALEVFGSSIHLSDDGKTLIATGEQKRLVNGENWDDANSSVRWYGGAVVAVQSGSTMHFEFGGTSHNLQEWFTFNSDTLVDYDIPFTPQYLVEKELPVSPTEKTFTPATPTVKPHVEVPQKESYSVAVHPVLVAQKPINDKEVVNTDNVSIDGKLVAKGSTVVWELKNENLKAGRETVTAYVMEDPVPAGFLVNLDGTKEKNAGAYIVTLDEAGMVRFEATDLTLGVMNANRSQDLKVPVAYLVGVPQNDGGTYENVFSTTITTPKGEYKTVSDKPVVYTPGVDPEDPRQTPNGENPTPNDNLIQPKKDVVDETGESINGQSVLPNTKINYILTQNFDQYKDMVASKDSIGKGFLYAEDYLDVALDGKSMVVNSITASNGDDVSQLLNMYHVLSQDALDEKLQEIIKNSGISPVGEFYLWVAKDPQAFYEAYVQKGLDITYNVSFKIKDTFTEGDITNQTYQIDFGNGYYSNVVVNHLPKLEVHKDVLDKQDGISINNGIVGLGEEATYKLEGWVVPVNRSYDLYEYKFVDQLQHTHDMFLRDSVVAKVDITLKDGTVISSGTDLTEYTNRVYNEETGLYELAFKEEFLKQIPRSSEFGADAFLVVKRIAVGDVENGYTLYVNGNPVKSEIVRTSTPEPVTPTVETPVQPASVPTVKSVILPQTGEVTSALGALGTVFSSLGLAGLGLKRGKKDAE